MQFLTSVPRWQKIVGAFALVVLIFAAFGYLGVPRILRAQLPSLVREATGRQAELGEVSFDPFLFRLDVHDARVFDQRGGDFVGFARLTIDFDPLDSLLKLEYHFKEARLVDPLVDLEFFAETGLDLPLLTASAAPENPQELAAESEALPPIEFELLSIEGGTFVYTDRSRATPFERRVGPIEIEITNFGTRPGVKSPYGFQATTANGATLAWAGEIGVDPPHSAGDISIENIALPWMWEFIEDRAHFVIREGKVDISAKYSATMVDDATKIDITDGSVRVSGLVVTPRGDENPFITLPLLEVEGIVIDVDQQTVSLDRVHSRGALLAGHLTPDGAFSWIEWLALDASAAAESEASEPAASDSPTPTLTLALAALALEDFGFAFEDQTTSPPALLSVRQIALDVRGISLDLSRALPVELALSFGEEVSGEKNSRQGEGGSLRITGDVTPAPLLLDLEMGAEAIDLTPFAPYLADVGAFQLRRATASAAGKLHVAATDSSPIVRYTGEASLDDLALADPVKGRDFLRLGALSLSGIDVATAPLSVGIAEVELRKPFVNVSIDETGVVNLARVFGGGAAASQEEPIASAPGKEAQRGGQPIRIGRVKLVDGAFEFHDQSITPSFRTSLDELSGTIDGISSDPEARAQVELAGKLDLHAPLLISGALNPLASDAYTDLAISLSNLELSSFTPYSGKYAGYEIAKGKFAMDLAYKLDARRVEGQNKLLLDQLAFGGKVESEDATSLPVPLAVALLKDKRGEIHIDLPVSGNLDDPEFSYGRVLLRTFVNLIAKAATSPFGLLGNLVGFNADELAYVAFPPGDASLSAAEREKLGLISKALGERPALRLEVRGAATASDLPGLRAAALDRELVQLRFDQLSARERKNMQTPDELVLAPGDHDDLLEALYAQRLGESRRSVRNRLRAEREARGEPEPADEQALVRAAMRRSLEEAQQVGERELQELARARAEAVHAELVVATGIAEERVFVVGAEVGGPGGAAVEGETRTDGSVHCPLTLSGS